MIPVTCAIIRNEDDEILVVQRGEKTDLPYKWEFPGGKLKDGESEEMCIIREIKEELSMEIIICSTFEPVVYDYGYIMIKLIPFVCDTLDELPVLSEHVDFKWIAPENLRSVDLCEADVFVADRYIKTQGMVTACNEPFTDKEQSEELDRDLKQMINSMMSRQEAEWISTSAADNPELFRKLLDYSFKGGDQKLAFRASWILTKACEKVPELIYPHLSRMIEGLKEIDNESTERSFMKILTMADLKRVSERHQGILVDHCFNALRSGFSAIAIKAYSMEIIYHLALIYPDLAHELSSTIKMLQSEDTAAGIIARGQIILKKLAEISGTDQGSGH